MIKLTNTNNTFLKIETSDRSILNHIQESYTFDVPGAKFMQAYKSGQWDGKIRLFNLRTRQIYLGLKAKIIKFLDDNDYEFEDCTSIKNNELTQAEFDVFLESLQLPFEVRDFQKIGIFNGINEKRCLNLISTGGGKSLVIYGLVRWMMNLQKSTLVIVPTVNLVTQLNNDFKDYSVNNGFDVDSNVHCISGGKEKSNEHPVVISTWQSIYKLGSSWLNNFDMIICDEVHLATSACISKIFEDATDVEYRIGLSGTLRDSKTNALVLEGLFGKIYELTTTRELIDAGHLSELKIRGIILNYEDHIKKIVSKLKYQDEIDFLVGHDTRNEFIKRLALQCKGPTLIIFNFVEKHGKVLYEMIKESSKEREVFFLSGATKDSEREYAKNRAKTDDVILLASYSLFSTGTNVPTLANIIFAHPRKSKISVLQSIGRVLRKAEGKKHAVLYDVADDLSWKSKTNMTYKHFQERIGYYNKAKLDYTLKELSI
jgi:superfamily II DNA or RNA helicase